MEQVVRSELRRRVRTAVRTLCAALAVARQHPDRPELQRPARLRAVRALLAATSGRAITLTLHGGAVHFEGQQLLEFQPDDVPFGPLRSAGIGQLVLAADFAPALAESLLERLAAMPTGDRAGARLALWFADARVPGAILQAACDAAGSGQLGDAAWQVLPPPMPRSPELDAMVQRDAAANLPALAARQLLEDAEQFGSELGGLLERTMARLLADDDLPTATWLLDEALQQPMLDPVASTRLVAMARERCTSDWLREQITGASTEDLMSLTSLVMQLGDDVAERFAAAATAVAHPLTQWLCELLGRPN